jgi:hypothetical protein
MNGQAMRKEAIEGGDEQEAIFEEQGKWKKKKTLLSKILKKVIANN